MLCSARCVLVKGPKFVGKSQMCRGEWPTFVLTNKEPLFMMVLTNHGSCYESKEEVFVVPINCLKD